MRRIPPLFFIGWNKNHFSDLSGRVQQAKLKLENIQKQVQLNPSDSNLWRDEATAVKEYGDLSRAEESFLRQKSRVQWLNLGDQNTEFFFRAVRSYHGRNRIVSVSRDDGTRINEPREVKEEIVGYFQRLLSVATHDRPIDIDVLGRAMSRRLTPSQCSELAKEVSEEEIKDAFFSLKDNKAPGPD